MSLAARAKKGPTKLLKGPACRVGAVLEWLDPAESRGFARMLADPGWGHTQIATAYLEDYPDQPEHRQINDAAIARHRKRMFDIGRGQPCGCPKGES